MKIHQSYEISKILNMKINISNVSHTCVDIYKHIK